MKTTAKFDIQKMVQMSMLIAVSVASLYVVRFPIFPATPFLEYDIADVPALIGAMLFGPIAGFIILLISSAIQAFTISASSGWIGLVMHVVASGALVIIAGCIYKTKKDLKSLIIGLVLGSLAMTLLMIPLNFFFTGLFLGNMEAVKSLMIPFIIPFNLIKSFANSAITVLIFLPLRKIIKLCQ